MDISKLVTAEAKEAIAAMETVEDLRIAATSIDVKFSGNTGADKLRSNILEALDVSEDKDGDAIQELLNTPTGTDSDNSVVLNEPNVETQVTELKAPEPKSAADFLGKASDPFPEVAVIPKKPKAPTIPELLAMDPKTVKDPTLRRLCIRARALKLIRVRVTNIDPDDSQLSGAIISVISKYTGKVSQYVPFGDEDGNGYHLKQIIYDHIKNQKFALRKEKKGGKFGVKQYRTIMVNKFNIEILPSLTKKEIDELAAAQSASHAIDS